MLIKQEGIVGDANDVRQRRQRRQRQLGRLQAPRRGDLDDERRRRRGAGLPGAARESRAATILYCGSTLLDNPTLEAILVGVCGSFGLRGLIPAEGAYCGALGAAALAEP